MHNDQARIDAFAVSDLVRDVLQGSGRKRDVALFHVCRDVVETLDFYYAPPGPVPALPDALRGVSFPGLCELVREKPAVAFIFGTFRNLVLEHEETCARRLEILRSSVRTLLRLRELAHDAARINAMLTEIGAFVSEVWRRDLDVSGDRDWSLRVSRRYDLLPRSWREL